MNKQQAKQILKNTGYIGNEVGVSFDVAIKSMDKLEQIEKILDRTKEINGYPLNEIREVLKQE